MLIVVKEAKKQANLLKVTTEFQQYFVPSQIPCLSVSIFKAIDLQSPIKII